MKRLFSQMLAASLAWLVAVAPVAAAEAYDAPMATAGADRFDAAPLKDQPGFARVNIPTLGAGSGSAAPPPAAYTPLGTYIGSAVALGTTTDLGTGTSKQLTMLFWIKAGNGATGTTDATILLGPSHIRSLRTGGCEPTVPTPSDGLCAVIDTSSNVWRATFSKANATVAATDAVQFLGVAGSVPFRPGKWDGYLVSFDTATQAYGATWTYEGAGALFDPIALGQATVSIPANLDVDLSPVGGLGFMNWGPGNTGTAGQAEIFIAKESIACTGVGAPFADCTGAHTLSPSKVAGFLSSTGLPMDMGPLCKDPTGNQPIICLTGNSTQMLTNKGSLAVAFAAAQNGAGNDISALVDNAYGPGGIPSHVATNRWATGKRAYGTGTSLVLSAATNPITAGDLLIAIGEESDTSGTADHTMLCPTNGTLTWTTVGPKIANGNSLNGIVCYAFADATVAAGGTIGTITWTTANTRTTGYVLLDYANVASVDGAATGMINDATTASPRPTPSLTTGSANETIVGGIIARNGATNTYGPPSAGVLRYREVRSGTFAQIVVGDQVSMPAGSSTLTTFSDSATETTLGFSLGLVPN